RTFVSLLTPIRSPILQRSPTSEALMPISFYESILARALFLVWHSKRKEERVYLELAASTSRSLEHSLKILRVELVSILDHPFRLLVYLPKLPKGLFVFSSESTLLL